MSVENINNYNKINENQLGDEILDDFSNDIKKSLNAKQVLNVNDLNTTVIEKGAEPFNAKNVAKNIEKNDSSGNRMSKELDKHSNDAGSLLDGILSFIGIREKKSDKLAELKRKDKREKHSINQSNSDLNRAKYAIKLDINPVNSSVKENELIDQKVKERINNQQTEEQIGDIIFNEGDVKG